MERDADGQDETATGVLGAWSRRTLLRATGAAAGLTGLGGATVAGAPQESGGETGTGNETAGGEGDSGGGTQFVADLIDPVFGYPLAADESDDVDVEYVVEAYTEEGPGDHENFPLSPDSQGDGTAAAPFEFPFDPVGLHVTTADLVEFHSTVGEHTATAMHEKFSIPQREMPTRVPDEVPGFTSPPIVDGEAWIYQFPEPGVYDLVCLPHLAFGMVMRVVVSEPDAEPTESELSAQPPTGALPPNAQLVLGAPELEPAAIVDQESVAWADLTLEPSAAATGSGTGTGSGTEAETGTETPAGADTAAETE